MHAFLVILAFLWSANANPPLDLSHPSLHRPPLPKRLPLPRQHRRPLLRPVSIPSASSRDSITEDSTSHEFDLLSRVTVAKEFIETGFGTDPLFWACHTGNDVILRMLLRRPLHPPAYLQRMTDMLPNQHLRMTDEDQRALIIRSVLDYGVDFSQLQRSLSEACKLGHLKIVQLLVDTGKVSFRDLTSGLRAAVLHNQLEVARLLLDHGADPNGFAGQFMSFSAKTNNIKMLELLLEKGHPDVGYGDAIIVASAMGHLEAVGLLITHGADIHVRGDMPLLAATRTGNADVVRLLLDAGADIASRDYEAVLVAARHERSDVAQAYADKFGSEPFVKNFGYGPRFRSYGSEGDAECFDGDASTTGQGLRVLP
jgi:ankyrin repeat protein